MPQEQRITERYWTWCKGWLGIPYPCRKTRTVTKVCYTFSVVHTKCYGVYEVLWGCENGREYRWTGGCFGYFDAYLPGPITRCFDSYLTDKGSCSEGNSIPPGGQIP